MNLPVAPLGAAAIGAAAALGIVAMPVAVLEGLVMDSGLPAVLSAAEPPLGHVARIVVALGVGGFVAALSWVSLFVLFGTRTLAIGKSGAAAPEEAAAPAVRRADAHPDAPPRPPLLATRDLGTPFLDVKAEQETTVADPVGSKATFPVPRVEPVEQPLPQDFDQPLAAFDPAAIPAKPVPAPVPVAPLRRQPRPATFDESERFEVFELTPPVRPALRPQPIPARAAQAEPIVRPETDASIHALLERLERGVVSKGLAKPAPAPREAERGLEEALVTLRNLARRA